MLSGFELIVDIISDMDVPGDGDGVANGDGPGGEQVLDGLVAGIGAEETVAGSEEDDEAAFSSPKEMDPLTDRLRDQLGERAVPRGRPAGGGEDPRRAAARTVEQGKNNWPCMKHCMGFAQGDRHTAVK